MTEALLEAKSISKKYESGYVLQNVDLSIEACQFISVLGHSGSGKSTMLNILSTLLKPTSGQVFYKGRDITQLSKKEISRIRREDIGMVFQHYIIIPNLTVEENIQLGNNKMSDAGKLEELCQLLGIQHLLKKYPYQLSGGEQQRMCIARAVIKNPAILFCDEATGALDSENSKNIIVLLHDIKKRYGTSIIFTTHNREIAKTADRIVLLEDGHIIKNDKNTNILSPDRMSWEI
ncbi:ABC transporter ATP-binding protein [Streptococcus macacae]|uniref:ABC transporter, ATP-binding protein n=1 Tax=Streptococcus macacae NCTC 11558 TaxID=764298 RepID=G5JVJ6_9STRE|nr:ABC transporter ATP-binding protein [Streptococcus macacae]EHJ52756.1 ABC transporter, ATP-binding protein [Streptococcus macacae NCTC 11558]SUN78590.1 antimicrobial peptide ABC transporter ATPase component [Streptococcus macacae NCTC 11558]